MVGVMATHLTLQLDPENHSLYIYVRPADKKEVTRTEVIEEGVLLDLGKRGRLMGVEVLGSKAVGKLFSRVSKEPRLKPLEKLAGKKSLLARLIA
jgi:uncharacterized protein YuzE